MVQVICDKCNNCFVLYLLLSIATSIQAGLPCVVRRHLTIYNRCNSTVIVELHRERIDYVEGFSGCSMAQSTQPRRRYGSSSRFRRIDFMLCNVIFRVTWNSFSAKIDLRRTETRTEKWTDPRSPDHDNWYHWHAPQLVHTWSRRLQNADPCLDSVFVLFTLPNIWRCLDSWPSF
jgi:hypothetical protein